MSKNRQGHTKSGGNQEWGRKARKEEDRLRGTNNQARREAIQTGLDEIVSATDVAIGDEVRTWTEGDYRTVTDVVDRFTDEAGPIVVFTFDDDTTWAVSAQNTVDTIVRTV